MEEHVCKVVIQAENITWVFDKEGKFLYSLFVDALIAHHQIGN